MEQVQPVDWKLIVAVASLNGVRKTAFNLCIFIANSAFLASNWHEFEEEKNSV